ncbi:hypothetical protein PsYK624_133740 [Phanerochaete sordida]|uniref:Protein kinase domain-containing protein n=1 Tax=Phanerochaete sordida TaxID=48140 RepID=A0A9P3GLF3_9APHY|nr:hypothetical protein PsYK624_133740 [Phanerochaete sordida]
MSRPQQGRTAGDSDTAPGVLLNIARAFADQPPRVASLRPIVHALSDVIEQVKKARTNSKKEAAFFVKAEKLESTIMSALQDANAAQHDGLTNALDALSNALGEILEIAKELKGGTGLRGSFRGISHAKHNEAVLSKMNARMEHSMNMFQIATMISIHKSLHEVQSIRCTITNAGDPKIVEGIPHADTCQDSGPGLAKCSAVEQLICAAQNRRTQLAAELGDVDEESSTGLNSDQLNDVLPMLQTILAGDTREILDLRDGFARDVLDLFDSILRPWSANAVRFQAALPGVSQDFLLSLQRLFVRLCEASLQLPERLWLSDVHLKIPYPVARGGFGDVYQGEYRGDTVAMKALRIFPQQVDNTKDKKAFYREIALVRGLSHENICPIIGVHQEVQSDSICVVLPWMDYGNVLDYRAREAWSADDATRLIGQVASGLAYLHSANVVHGDLHAGNVLVDVFRNAVLTDFGLSNFADSGMSCSAATPGPRATWPRK